MGKGQLLNYNSTAIRVRKQSEITAMEFHFHLPTLEETETISTTNRDMIKMATLITGSPKNSTVPTNEDQVIMPVSVTDRIGFVRRSTFQQSLGKSTKRLQDDLRQTMKTYANEKSRLIQQLALLKTTNLNTDAEMESRSITISESRQPTLHISQSHIGHDHSRFYPAPDRMSKRSKQSNRQESELSFADLGDEERVRSSQNGFLYSNKEKLRGCPTLPSLQTAPEITLKHRYSKNRWSNTQKLRRRLPSLEQTESLDYATWKSRSHSSITNQKQSMKKVQFRGVLYKTSSSVSEYASEGDNNNRFLMEYEPESNTNITIEVLGNHCTRHTNEAYPSTPSAKLSWITGDNGHFPACDRTVEDASYHTQKNDSNELNAATDVVHVVREHINQNERKLMSGEKPHQIKCGSTLCDYLLSNNSQQRAQKDISKDKQNTVISFNTAERLGRRSNAVQLQNYLRKCSRSQRMLEHMEAEEYRIQQEQLG